MREEREGSGYLNHSETQSLLMEKVAQLTKVMRMEESVGFNFCDYFAMSMWRRFLT